MELTRITGIGSERAKVLINSGVESVGDLAKLTLEELDNIIPNSRLAWIEEAKELIAEEAKVELVVPLATLEINVEGEGIRCPNCSSRVVTEFGKATRLTLYLKCLACGKKFTLNL